MYPRCQRVASGIFNLWAMYVFFFFVNVCHDGVGGLGLIAKLDVFSLELNEYHVEIYESEKDRKSVV